MLRNPRNQNRRTRSQVAPGADQPAGAGRGMLLAALLMCCIGWGGLAYLVASTRPRIGGEVWLFFILLQIAVTGSAIPLLYVISQRFAAAPAPVTGIIVRRSIWIGFIAVLCAWLMIPRYLSLPIVFILILLFLVIEIFLRNRELANER